MRITNCKVNGIVNPMGYQFDSLSFSYVVEESIGKKQKSARICIYKECEDFMVLDTGWRDDINNLGTLLELELKPYTRYLWNVSVRTDAGEEETSEYSFFETAKESEKWLGRWITCDVNEQRHPVFVKCFNADKEVKRARLYICGLGLYEASLNGKRVGNEILTPYCNDYSEWLQYQTYDVTDFLKTENEIEVTLAPGWYMGRFGFTSKPGDSGYYGDRYKLIAELHITYEDGTKQITATDDSWKVYRSNIIFSNIYDGEQVDDTLEPMKEEAAVYCSEYTPLAARMSIPVYVQEEISAKELIFTPAGEYVYDLGQNFAGGFRLKVHEPKGTKIHVQVGEILQHGNFYRENLRTAKAEYIYISDGEAHILEPVFTYYGYRYAKVTGIANPKKEDFIGLAYYSDIKRVGSLKTGDNKLNQLLSNISWGQKSNFIDVPMDCPQRDERMGWTADTQVFVPTAAYMTDSYAFYRKYLYDIRAEQSHRDGAVPCVVPAFGMQTSSSVWSDAACIIPWSLYLYYGNIQILKESYQSMKAWDSYIDKIDDGNHGWREDVYHYGDWLSLDNPSIYFQKEGGTDVGFIAEVYRLNNIKIIEKTAHLLGVGEEADYYHGKAKRLLAAIREEYFTATGRPAINTQTAYVLSLYYDIAPDRKKIIKALIDDLRSRGNKIQTGFVGTPFICKVLSAEGYDERAYEIIHNEEYPGWLYVVNLGATTIWERWNSVNPDGTISELGMNSLNHYAYGSIGEWLWQTMAGIIPVEEVPGFKKVILRPVADYKTGFADAVYSTPAGTYKTYWKVIDEQTVELKVEIPFDCEAVLQLPNAENMEEQVLGAGKYEFLYHTRKSLIKMWSVDTTLDEVVTNPQLYNQIKRIIPSSKVRTVRKMPLTMRELIEKYEPKELAADKLKQTEALMTKYNNMPIKLLN